MRLVEIDQIAERLKAGKVLVLTGAGCSTPSGIGDYRDENGDWKRRQPIQHNDFVNNHEARKRYWARSQIGYPEFLQAKPNDAHHAIAVWESRGMVDGVITQNVDRLHQRAGSRAVIDLHGRLDQVICLDCRRITPRDELQPWLEQQNPEVSQLGQQAVMAPDGDADLTVDDFSGVHVPACEVCGGILKPNVVFYGDGVPVNVVESAYDWVEKASTLFVVGSSLMVYSSFRFVRKAWETNTPVHAINRGKTRGDDYFATKIDDDCVRTLALLNQALGI